MKIIYKRIDDSHILFSTPKKEYVRACKNKEESDNVMKLLQFLETVEIKDGMNRLLKMLSITYRRDESTGRPRVNKEGRRLDREQKESGNYYYVKNKN